MGFKLKEIRTLNNMSQQELSRISGVGQGLISDIEKGEVKNPRIDTVLKLCTALGVDVGEMLSVKEA